MDLAFLSETLMALLTGLPLTLNLAAASVLVGAVLAVLLAAMRLSGLRALSWPAGAVVFVFRGTPLLVQVFLIYYGLGQFRPSLQAANLWWFFREPYWCALTALALNTAAYSAEILRGGVMSIPAGQIEAARACGMSRFTALHRIVAPLALRQALPGYSNEIVIMVKATSLASIITLAEVTFIAQKLISQTYRAVEIFVCAGSIYLLVNIVLTRLVALAEHRLSRHLRAPSRASASPAPPASPPAPMPPAPSPPIPPEAAHA